MKYKALRTIATVFKILGWITLVLGILSSCGMGATIIFGGMASIASVTGSSTDSSAVSGLVSGGLMGAVIGIVAVLIGLIVTGIQVLFLFAIGEAIYVILDIEENTRKAGALAR